MAENNTGRRIVLETFRAEGVEYVFGNPGTTELPLIDAMSDFPELGYIFALQEAVAVSMADGYAHASGKVGVVNLHVAPGLGNGLGSVYNAWEGQTPMVVTAGQQDTRMRLREPLLGHDLVAMAAPLTKWSVQAETADELPELLHRAFKVARETPSGPVFVALPINVLIEETSRAALAPSHLHLRSAPDPAGLEAAARRLLGARRPMIFCGDMVARSDAVSELVALAELIGAPVHTEVLPAHVNFPNQHPHFRGRTAGDHGAIRPLVGDADLILLVGGEFFEEVWYAEASPFPDGAVVLQIDPSPRNLGRNFRVDCGLLGDPKRVLEGLVALLSGEAGDDYREAASARGEELRRQQAAEVAAQAARIERSRGNRPMSPARLMHELARVLPETVMVAGEAITAAPDLNRGLRFAAPLDYLASRGGGIGQGLPSAVGLKLARPERPVVCLSGDGSALYTIQALWTAAHHRIPVVFIILDNRVYRILKFNMDRYRKLAGETAREGYPHMDLTGPELDFVSLSAGFGVKAKRVSEPAEVGPAVEAALASGEPYLLDVIVDG